MAITSDRYTVITLSSGLTLTQQFAAAQNTVSPGEIETKDLTTGFNALTVPTAGGATAKAVTIIPPAGNAQTITLKGVTGDTGVALHLTDPTTISLGASPSIGLTVGGNITGVKFIWT